MAQATLSEVLLIINHVQTSSELIEKISHIYDFKIPETLADKIIDYRESRDNKRIKTLAD